MRIGIDARSLQQKGAGVGRYLANLIKHYPVIDPTSEYVLYFSKETDINLPPKFSVKTIKLPAMNFNFTWLNICLPWELSVNKIDLFHCPFYGLPFIQPCPMIVTVHDIIYEIHPEWFSFHQGMSFRLLARWGVRSAKKIIADSEFTKKDIIERYKVDEKKIEVVYLAPDESFKKIADQNLIERARLKYGIRNDYLIHVGAIHARRNIKRLLEAFQKIKEKKFDLQLVLIGGLNVKAADFYSLIHTLDLQSEVLHLAYVPEEDLACLYNGAKALIYASLYEGFGLPLVEAMACGIPVIASNVSSIPEIMGDAGILFDPYNVDEISSAMELVLRDTALRSKLSGKSLKRASEFSWLNAARQTVKVYNEAMSDSAGQ